MPIQVELIRDNRVILQTYSDPLDSAHMSALRNKMDRVILPAAEGKVHIIADFRAVKNLPGTILSSGTTMLSNSHPNTGQIVCVTPSAFINAMARIFVSLSAKANVPVKIVQSLEEAYAEIDTLLANET